MDIKILISLIFVIVGIASIFAVKTRTSNVAALIIVHLLLIFFLSLTITNYSSFKEIILTIISYLMLVLFLITNYDIAKNYDESKGSRALQDKVSWLTKFFIGVGCFLIFSASLYLTDIAFDKMKSERNNPQNRVESVLQPIVENSESRKIMRVQKKLSENFLFKRSSDIILIIAIASLVLLVMQRKENSTNS